MAGMPHPLSILFLALGLVLGVGPLGAQTASPPADAARPSEAAPKPEMTANCPGLVARPAPGMAPVTFASLLAGAADRHGARLIRAALAADEVRITYVGHSTFLLESPQLVRIATDYNNYVKPPVLPDIVTMNHAHSTHYTDTPEPGIKHVLRGWAENEQPARIDLSYRDVRVRNVPTNLRSWSGGTERHGNSIFVFEMANLCIGHLGHLHHTLTQQQLNEIGRLDVVMVPVDGGATLDLDGMVEVLKALKAPLMIPMHYFSAFTLQRFLDRLGESAQVAYQDVPSLVVSKTTLPTQPTVAVLSGR